MATRTVKMCGQLVSDAASITILWDGEQVVSGAITPVNEQADGHAIIGTWTFDDGGQTDDIVDHTLSFSVTSGMAEAGPLWFSTPGIDIDDPTLGNDAISDAADIAGAGYWRPNNTHPYGDGGDTDLPERSNILINGVAPTLDPGQETTGTADAPTWAGWHFCIAAGETLTCTARCPKEWVAETPAP